MISRSMSNKIATFSGAVLFTCVTALAQMSPGGGAPQAQQPTNPSANSTMNSADAMQQQQQASAASVMQDKEFVRSGSARRHGRSPARTTGGGKGGRATT